MKIVIAAAENKAIANLLRQFPEFPPAKKDMNKVADLLEKRDPYKNKFMSASFDEEGNETIVFEVEFITDVIDFVGGYFLDLAFIFAGFLRMVKRLETKSKEITLKWSADKPEAGASAEEAKAE